MANPYVGQITVFAFPFAPQGWAACDGSTLPINQYGSLYSLIGATFGGNGSSSFGIPNMGNASPCGAGTGPGLTPRRLGQAFGAASVTLDLTTIPAHTHNAQAAPFSRGSQPDGTPTVQSGLAASNGDIYSDGTPGIAMSAVAVSPAGNGGAHNNMQPFIGMNYCIALLGEYPYFD